MMFDHGGKINDVYPWCAESSDLRGQEVSITYSDTLSPSGFALDSLLVRLAKDAQRDVFVLSLNRPKRHYEAVFRKNGLDFEALKRTGKIDLYVLDMSSSSSSSSSCLQYRGNEDGTIIDISSVEYNDSVATSSSECWESIVAWISSKSLEINENAVLLIDDLEMLNLIAGGHSDDRNVGMNFLYQLRSIFDRNPSFLLVTMGFDGVVYGEKGDISMTEYMKESSTISISINPLASGYSSDCHGIIRIDYGLKIQLYKYKALDSGIKCVEILNSI